MKSRSIVCTTLAALAGLGISSLSLADEEKEKWSIEEAKAPTKTLAFTATEGTWMAVDVSPDGQHLVFDLLGHIYEMPIDGGEATRLTDGRSWNMQPRYAPDGSRIAFTSDRSGSDDLWVIDRETGDFEQVSENPLPVYRPTWSADGGALYGSILTQAGATEIHVFDFLGDSQKLIEGETFNPGGGIQEDTGRGLLYFDLNDGNLYASGPKIKTLDTKTGEVEVFVDRSGGGFSPALSPDGRRLAYLNRADQETVLVVEDIDTRRSRIVFRNIDRDRLEYKAYMYEIYPGIAWHPDGDEIFASFGGQLHAINVENGEERVIPFEAPVERELNETIRFAIDIPEGTTTTRLHRWGTRTPDGVLFEALGDLWIHDGDGARRLTDTAAHETSPVYSPADGRVYFARWTDDELGSAWSMSLDGRRQRQLTTLPSQYGSLAVAPDGDAIAYLRGRGSLLNGGLIEQQAAFDLVLRVDGGETTVTRVDWTAEFPVKHPPAIVFDPDGEHLLFSEIEKDEDGKELLVLKRIRRDGLDETTLYKFPHAVRAVPSPDLEWIAFREYHRSFITPLRFLGSPVTVSAQDEAGLSMRVDPNDGIFMGWSADGDTLAWTRGSRFFEKSIDDIVAGHEAEEDAEPIAATASELAVEFEVAAPEGTLALTNARLIPMTGDDVVIDNATVVIESARIVAAGADVAVPDGAEVIDLDGQTVVPGFIDSHAHPSTDMSTLHVVEQRPFGLHASLAHGVTTVYELYGSPGHKDIWLDDMIRAGKITGPRLFTVGPPIYGLREFRPKLFREIGSYEQALEQLRYNKDHGATAVKDYVHFTRGSRHQMTTAARELGLNIFAETAGNPPMNLTQVIDGQTGLEHSMGLTPLFSDVVRLLAASETGITPTLLVVYNGPGGQSYFNMRERVWEDEKLLNFARPEALVAARRPTHFFPDDLYAPEMAAEHRKLMQEGVSIQMGGHGQMLGLDAHWELELMVQGGFTPLEALQTATINGARYHGLDRDLGTIETGKLADLVVMSEDPLADIRNTRSIRYVIKQGIVYNGDDLARVYPDPAPAKPMYMYRD